MNTTEVENLVHAEVFYKDPEFWVGLAFVIVVVFLFKPIKKAMFSLLQKRIEDIKNSLQEAEELKLKAQALYAEYERKIANKDEEIRNIISEQNAIIAEKKDDKFFALERYMEKKQREINNQIEVNREAIEKEIQQKVIRKAFQSVFSTLREKLGPKEYSVLIDESINNLTNISLERKEF